MDPRIDLAISHDRPHSVGDTVQGTVGIQSDFESASGLDVQLITLGRGGVRKERARVRVHHGPLTRGMQFPFSLPIPADAPFTFEGHRYRAEWIVQAQVDVPWKIDPKSRAPLHVDPRAVTTTEIAQVVQVPEKPESKTSSVLRLLGTLFVVAIRVFVLITFLPFAPFFLFYLAKRRALASRMSGLEVGLPERHFVLGEWVPVTVRCRLKRAVDVERLTLLFQGTEQWSTGTGKTRRTRYRHFHDQKLLGLSDAVVAPLGERTKSDAGGAYRGAGRPEIEGPWLVWRTAVQLPADGLPTSKGVYYKLQAKLELRGLPDARVDTKIPTVPARLIEAPAVPARPPVAKTSGQLVFVPRGAALPEGVDATVHGGGTTRWILLTMAGLAGLASAAFVVATGPSEMLWSAPLWMWTAPTLALLTTGAGLYGYWSVLYR